ncbi:MAG: 2TM domain-containing protein [Desulfobacula sp.]|uniref:2TM domain-containing protein n=1 Tax=Desulfobacula sp. TaxID=2593537 RepID=UPI0025BD8EA5|nr:2TM domain-containing protein [Desulfobacula sp.]MCD4722618.1 2TM domain-containing protein [Desulfobacula sp.]
MSVRKLRLEKSWSQEQLAEICNLSVRTIQRIERGQKPSLESLKALSAAFDTDVTYITKETDMSKQSNISLKEEQAIIYVRDIKGFYTHLITYAIVIVGLFALNLITSSDYLWAIWPALGWGIGVSIHGINVFEVFNLFGPDWEKRQIEKRLKRNS